MNHEEFSTAIRDRGIVAAYGEATGREDWATKLAMTIPEYMQEGVVYWIVLGIIPGGFLQAVIEGDLYEAVGRADDMNVNRLPQYVRFFYNYAPSGCFRRGALERWKGMLDD